jgi:hypothetical protein
MTPTSSQWIYRRDPLIRRPWSLALLRRGRLRYLAPELQLLFKSKHVRPKDQIDAEVVIPELEPDRLAFLRAALPDDHRWQRLLP